MKSFACSTIIVSVILTTLLFSNNVFSEELSYSEKLDFCKTFETTAHNIMEARQNGVPMSTLMEIKVDDETIREFIGKIIIAAYDVPRFNINDNQQEAILDFKNAVYSKCIEDLL